MVMDGSGGGGGEEGVARIAVGVRMRACGHGESAQGAAIGGEEVGGGVAPSYRDEYRGKAKADATATSGPSTATTPRSSAQKAASAGRRRVKNASRYAMATATITAQLRVRLVSLREGGGVWTEWEGRGGEGRLRRQRARTS